MAYYLDIFSPQTYEAFLKSDKTVSGFRTSQKHIAEKIKPGDKLICYLTKVSRWVGLLEVTSHCYIDNSPRFYEMEDPFIVRLRVKPIVCLSIEMGIPIKVDEIWNTLSFTKTYLKSGSQWTGKLRSSLNTIDDNDGSFLERILTTQENNSTIYPLDENEDRKLQTRRVHGPEKVVNVTIPQNVNEANNQLKDEISVRQSIKIQALLGKIGEMMGFSIWLPRGDRSRVLQEWKPANGTLIDVLPLNYNEATNNTIEQIDVLWLDKRYIVRAFEVEHTTSIYSGILRMADLMALQPNLDIKLHIVAPSDRKEKVLDEINRPVFSLLGKRPLSETCTFLSYDSLYELARQKHLSSMKDNVLEAYEEVAD